VSYTILEFWKHIVDVNEMVHLSINLLQKSLNRLCDNDTLSQALMNA